MPSQYLSRSRTTAGRNAGKLTMTNEAPDRILRLKTVLDRTGLSRATLYRKIQNGTFPRQVRIAARCAGWRESAINDWMKNPMFYSVEDSAVS
jgi:prophage regulatory protein